MRKHATRTAAVLLWAAAAACAANPAQSGPRVVQPGAPGEPTRVRTAAQIAAQDRPTYTESDVEFMREMIGHHQQALTMTALVEGRSDRREIHLLARRIELTQEDEIALMRRWLEQRGETPPAPGDHAGHADTPGAPAPSGMLTPAELAELAAASGTEFDRLFLESMIRHHQGAVEMVSELFASPAGGQETEVIQFASGVAADQPIEISRMQRMLSSLQ